MTCWRDRCECSSIGPAGTCRSREQCRLGTTEIWNLVNLTDDSHPIHLHLVRFQVLDRRNFDPFNYQTNGRIVFTGPPLPADPSEAGWKDTVRADPGMITRIIVRFEGTPAAICGTATFSSTATTK